MSKVNKQLKAALDIVSFVTFAYSLSFIGLTFLYCLPRILVEFSSLNVSHINESMTFPLDIFAWGLLAICSSYCCVDRAAFTVKTSMMDIGQGDKGDTKRLITVIVILAIIFVESYLFNLFLSHPVTIFNEYGKQEFSGINLPLDGIVSALVSSCVLCVTGDGAISIAKNISVKTKKDE